MISENLSKIAAALGSVNQKIVFLCDRPCTYPDLSIKTKVSNGMVPVCGKPVIGTIFDYLLPKDNSRATLVVGNPLKHQSGSEHGH